MATTGHIGAHLKRDSLVGTAIFVFAIIHTILAVVVLPRRARYHPGR
jgi:hypothetical protein